MIRNFIHMFYVIILVIYILISTILHGSIQRPMCMLGRAMNIAPTKIYGKREENVQVFTFNHPSYLEKFVLFQVFGDFCALARDMINYFPIANFIMKKMGCVLVKPQGGQGTTERILKHLEKTSKPFFIATSSGIVSNDKIPSKLPTIAFRLHRRVQPIVIVYNSSNNYPNLDLPDTLPKALQALWNPSPPRIEPSLFFLPSIDPVDFSSAEECASHVRKQMMYVLAYLTNKRT